jgi:hypothetical protein
MPSSPPGKPRVVVVVVATSVAVLRVTLPSVVTVLGVVAVPGCTVASPGVVCVLTLPAAPVGALVGVFVF